MSSERLSQIKVETKEIVDSFHEDRQDLLKTIIQLKNLKDRMANEIIRFSFGELSDLNFGEVQIIEKDFLNVALQTCFSKQEPDMDCMLVLGTYVDDDFVQIAWNAFVKTDLFLLTMIEISSMEEFSTYLGHYMGGVYAKYCYTLNYGLLTDDFYQYVADYLGNSVSDVRNNFNKGDGKFRDSTNFFMWEAISNEKSWSMLRMIWIHKVIFEMKKSQVGNNSESKCINPVAEFLARLSEP